MSHQLFFVLLSETGQDVTDNTEAEEIACLSLEDNGVIYTETGYYGGGICDYYEVGGRWAGLFNGQSSTVITDSILSELNAQYDGVRIFDPSVPEEISGHGLSKDDIGRWIVAFDMHV